MTFIRVSDNYIFVGWYTYKETEDYFEFDETPVTKDLVLYAGWYNDEDNTDTDKDGVKLILGLKRIWQKT